jgi:ABC-type dipeptide/oligopeptide/nickel transport system ATPase component/ABC-type dipeptide/oligopeptide/nickel transport system permease subunit
MISKTASKKRSQHRNITLWQGLTLLALLICVAIVAPMLRSTSAKALSPDIRLHPNGSHLLGTDAFGRDLFQRTLVATRTTLFLTGGATLIAVIGGIIIGVGVWILPQKVRACIIGVNNILVSFPTLIVALVVASVLGAGGWQAMIAVGVAGIPSFTRLVNNMCFPVVQQDFVLIARLLGVPPMRVLSRHVMPSIFAPLMVLATSHFVVVLIELSGLSFVGLGVQAPDYDFGKMLNDSLSSIYSQPDQILGPAAMLVITGVAVMLIGDGLAGRSQQRDGSGSAVVVTRTPIQAEATDGAIHNESVSHDLSVQLHDLHIETETGKALVKGSSIEIRRGEVLGIVGESGSGKSLTAMAIAGLLPNGLKASASVIETAGVDVLDKSSLNKLATKVGLVYQDPMNSMNPVFKLRTQLTETMKSHMGLKLGERKRRLVEAFRAVRMTDPERQIEQYPFEFSGGMLQRAMIAGATTTKPKLIIADEPTTALDVTVQAEVLRVFASIVRKENAALLFISHDLAVVRVLCDRVLVMHDGEIVEEISTEQLASGSVQHPYTRMLLEASHFVD